MSSDLDIFENHKVKQMNSVLKNSTSSQDYNPIFSVHNSKLLEYLLRKQEYQT